MTHNEKEEAKRLLERSKKQLEHIVAATTKNNGQYYDIVDSRCIGQSTISINKEAESYVDMSGNIGVGELFQI